MSEDPRLDRRVQFDPRSRSFPVRALVEGAAPRSYTWACVPVLDQGREGACFPAGTLVRMGDGSHLPIEMVRTLDTVVTAEGRFGTVVQTMVRHTSALVSVRLRGHMAVRCTPEHPFLTERGYVAASELQSSDRVAVTRWGGSADSIEAPVDLGKIRGVIEGTVMTGGVATEVAPLPSWLALTPALGRLLGLYAAEGHVTPNKVVWSFGGHEATTLAPETVALIKTCFDATARTQYRPNGTVNVVLYGQAWMRLFASLIPGTSKHGDKRLSGHIASGNPAFMEAVIDGWLAGDGHRRRTGVEGVTVSKCLALDMHAIANALGLRPALRTGAPSMNRHAATRQHRYDVAIGEGAGPNQQPMTDNAVWRKVQSVVPVDEWSGWVYNLHVAGDESYVADGLGVHNCVGFSWAHELAARPVVVAEASTELARSIYAEAQRLDPWEGEDYDGTSVLAGAKATAARGWVAEYRWCFSLDDLVAAVGLRGPAILGVRWYAGMFRTDAEGYVRPTGSLAGGHAILCRGVSLKNRRFLLHNSWGTSFGNGGMAWLDFADAERLLHEDGEAVIPVKRTRPA